MFDVRCFFGSSLQNRLIVWKLFKAPNLNSASPAAPIQSPSSAFPQPSSTQKKLTRVSAIKSATSRSGTLTKKHGSSGSQQLLHSFFFSASPLGTCSTAGSASGALTFQSVGGLPSSISFGGSALVTPELSFPPSFSSSFKSGAPPLIVSPTRCLCSLSSVLDSSHCS